jgi:N6-adenosine-specific RNA methylase IME4
MKAGDIIRIPVREIADENCVLFLWVIFNRLQDGLDVIKGWGFEYKSCAFVWVKKNKKSQSWFWGMGRWTRANPEICLIATRGTPKRISASVHSVVDLPIERHSKKPDEVRNRIVQLVGDLPRVELFAREKTPGWDVWGNEVESDIEIPVVVKSLASSVAKS